MRAGGSAVPQIEVRRHINGKPADVFAVYTDHVSWAEWAGIGPARLAREGVPAPNGVGCIRVLGPRLSAAHEEVLAYEPPKRMTYRIVKGFPIVRDHFGEVLFEPEGDGTLIVWRCRFESRAPGLGGIIARAITRMFRGALDGLAEKRFPD
jgi:uncharacterized protein YndB with AHSA1/START domain